MSDEDAALAALEAYEKQAKRDKFDALAKTIARSTSQRDEADWAAADGAEELVAAYGVQRLAAVLKRENEASRQLLLRLGYGAVDPRDALWQVAGPEELVLARGG